MEHSIKDLLWFTAYITGGFFGVGIALVFVISIGYAIGLPVCK